MSSIMYIMSDWTLASIVSRLHGSRLINESSGARVLQRTRLAMPFVCLVVMVE